MRETILQDLADIEKEYGVHIIFACEAGSRIWGTNHQNSDYDVRFLFHYPLVSYLELDQPKDSIDANVQHTEYSGWELGKSLRLLRKQNPTMLEWINSPETYINNNRIKENLVSLHQRFFYKKPLLYHYYNMAKRNYVTLSRNPGAIKQQLNIIRPLLICQWLFEKGSFPPLAIDALTCNMEEEIRQSIIQIISYKRQGLLDGNQVDSYLKDWINLHLNNLRVKIAELDDKPSYSNHEFTLELNTLYQSLLFLNR